MLFVMILLSITTKAQLVSYNGQDGENENAVNETPQEIVDRTINHRVSARLVPYKECSKETFQKALNGPVGSVEKRDMIAWINRVNAIEHATTFNGGYVITTDAEAILFLNKHLILVDNDGKEHDFKGLDYHLNSQATGQIRRGPYSSKKESEKWFALGNFASGNVHPGGSAMCGNFFAPDQSGASTTQAPPKTFGEKEYKSSAPSASKKQMSPKAQKFFSDAEKRSASANTTGAPIINNNVYVEAPIASIDRSNNVDARSVSRLSNGGGGASTPAPQSVGPTGPIAPGFNPASVDWVPGGQSTTSTTRVNPGRGGSSQDSYAAADYQELRGIKAATTATAVGTFLNLISNTVTGGMTVYRLGHQQPSVVSNYWNNGNTTGGQNWTGGYGTGTSTNTTGQNWTGGYGN